MSKKETLETEETVKEETVTEEETQKAAEENTADKELADTKDQLLRITAEYANFRKRSEKEKQDAYVFAKSETIKELLPVIDNLERALASESEDYDSLKKGVEITFNSLVDTLGKLGVEIFGTPGEEFVDVFQKGYKISDKIIRPAMVKSAN